MRRVSSDHFHNWPCTHTPNFFQLSWTTSTWTASRQARLTSEYVRPFPQSSISTNFSRKTSIMAVQFDGGVVIGADSRTTTGSYIVWLLHKFYTYSYIHSQGQSRHRQTYPCPWSHLLLSLRLCCRHASGRRHRPLLFANVQVRAVDS